jgi:hypothetical protein
MNLEAVGGVAAGLKPAIDLAKSLMDLLGKGKGSREAVELYGQIVAAHQSALTAQAAQATLAEEKRQLERRCADLEAWDLEKSHYQLQEIVFGVFAYALKTKIGGGEPTHYLCANCYQDGLKSILRRRHIHMSLTASLECFRCSTNLQVHGPKFLPGR